MRCTNNKLRLLCIVFIAALFISGCGSEKSIANEYQVYSSRVMDQQTKDTSNNFIGSKLCITEDVNYGTDKTHSDVAEGAGAFNLDTKEVLYSQNIFSKLYPASTTKIMTAYIILKYANLDDMVTVPEDAVAQADDSSICHLKAGDVISVEDLLYGLLLVSGNDAAVTLADYYSGSEEAFADIMNTEALKLGATGTHFTNSNGLPDEDHYTTVYDMYLIFSKALELDKFVEIISTLDKEANYTDASGEAVSTTWKNTNRYLTGATDTPEGFTVIGGKTGTTNAAGYCLVLYSLNSQNQRIVSIVYKADGKSNLYLLMNEIISGFAN